MSTRADWDLDRRMLAVGLLGFGALSLLYDDFGLNWQSVPDWVLGRGIWAYAAGAVEIIIALGLFFRRTCTVAAWVLVPYTLLWVLLLDLPPLLKTPGVEAAWLSVGERTELFSGVWILGILLARGRAGLPSARLSDERALRVARIVFGLALIPAGLSHLVYPSAVAYVPEWLPIRMFWLEATGVGHIAAGVAIITGVIPGIAAAAEAAMMSSFVLLVHIPRVVASPRSRMEWTMLFIAMAFSGAAWSTARSYRVVPRRVS